MAGKIFLICLILPLLIAFENLILIKKKTMPVVFCDQVVWSLGAYLAVTKFAPDLKYRIIVGVACGALFLFLCFIKFKIHQSEGADLDYSDRIFSLMAPINKLIKPKNMAMGRILPVNHNELIYNMRCLDLDDVILSGSTLVTGSTGSGKTTTMKTVLKQRIDQRKPVVFFDYKGEEDILDDIKGYAEQAGLPYYEFSARDCTFKYDPFTNLNETGKVEALMNTRRWSMDGADEHYKTSMQLAIQNLVRAYDNYREEKGETCNYIVGLYAFAESYHPEMNERDGFNNLKKSLEILLTSRAKDLFGDDPDFTFERDEPYVICFSFPSANKQLANNLSSFVFTDLMDRGTRRHYPNKLLLCVDEFGTLESSTLIKDLLEKGRSGGVQTVFSILDVNQIAMNSGEYFVNAILGTINNYIIHAGATQTTAELLAGVQKFDKSFDIMSLRKPYKGKKPTALFISKYPIFSKKGNQEVYRMIPYTSVLKKAIAKPKIEFPKPKDEDEDDEKNYKPIEDEIQSPTYDDEEPPKKELNPDDVDWTKPIDNIEDWL